MDSFYLEDEIKRLGLLTLAGRKAHSNGADKISIGNNVRIDDFCILSGKIEIKNYVHIAAYTVLYGGDDGIFIDDFVNISSRIAIYSVSDDYFGETMTSPLIPEKYKKILSSPVKINRHVIIGTGCTILPGVEIGEGSAIGAMSLINNNTDGYGIYAGIPIRKIKEKKRISCNWKQYF